MAFYFNYFNRQYLIVFTLFFCGFFLLPKRNFLLEPEGQSDYGLAVKKCILDYKDWNLWGSLEKLINNCLEKHSSLRNNSFFALNMGRFGERKYFLPPAETIQNCNWLTIGIGGDTLVEKQMKARYPECNIFGVEPSPSQAEGFEEFGTVIPVAVGVEAGNLTMRLRFATPPAPGMSRYDFREIPIEPLHLVLDKYLNSRRVHYSTLDIEGFEYPLVTALEKGKTFANEGVVFCQVDVELHSLGMLVKFRNNSDHVFQFTPFFRSFLLNSPYVPVHSDLFGTHHKVTFANLEDEECVRLFRFDKYFRI